MAVLALAIPLAAPYPAIAQGGKLKDCLSESWPQRQILCLREIAIASGDAEICLQADDPAVRWQCVAHYAEQTREPARCDLLPADDLDMRGVAPELCRAHLAIAWREPERCEALETPHLADSCLLQLVQLGEDRALCERIETDILADACYDL